MSPISQDNGSEPSEPSAPYEPHHHNLVRDRKKLRDQYGPLSYTKGLYFDGSETPMKPRNIRIRSSVPLLFAVGFVVAGIWFVVASDYPLAGAIAMSIAAVLFLFLSWIGFRTARLREKWELENPELAKNITY